MILPREPEPRPRGANRFSPGDLVRHVRYGYRGVVVAFDLACQADEGWYRSNQTQPDRAQPWYHVLVDGSVQTTYSAQQNLAPEVGGGPVLHPLVSRFFSDFDGMRYTRNDQPWPEL
ncbi:MAG: heat shock protein HspQ [Planctomycetota bacterium]